VLCVVVPIVILSVTPDFITKVTGGSGSARTLGGGGALSQVKKKADISFTPKRQGITTLTGSTHAPSRYTIDADSVPCSSCNGNKRSAVR